MLIDTHAHIYLDKFENDLDDVMARALDSHVEKILMPNIDITTIDQMHKVEELYPDIAHSMMGLHPCSVASEFGKTLRFIENELAKKTYIGIGEIGVDLYWDTSFIKEQKKAFLYQAHWAEELQIPIVIHCRESLDLVIDLLSKENIKDLRGVFHCFGGSRDQIDRIKGLNFHIGIGGVITYKNSDLKEVLTEDDLGMIVLETDAPYLSPVPFRGKRNESAYLTYVAISLAGALEMPIDEIATISTQNAVGLFCLE